jgi:hypothetical protein
MSIPDGFGFLIAIILILILVSIQLTLNMILREIKAIRVRMGAEIPEEERMKKHE